MTVAVTAGAKESAKGSGKVTGKGSAKVTGKGSAKAKAKPTDTEGEQTG